MYIIQSTAKAYNILFAITPYTRAGGGKGLRAAAPEQNLYTPAEPPLSPPRRLNEGIRGPDDRGNPPPPQTFFRSTFARTVRPLQ
ncbi:unnamed protein product [Macrosiphum euphorbiae]|uniref:Uncharacterized protein n=1 Tax=Macrosiphum euphorbiae TaxID=13131 RepID=A0AAV0XCV8_9HEMI|nr:unnamed protein product [Macrosiphum euphorbiae]